MQVLPGEGLKTFCPLLVLAALGVAGCGGGSGSVSGKVVFNGTTLKGGTISFIDSDDHGYNSPISEDGTYKIDKVPAGEVKVMVETKTVLAASKVPTYKPPPGQTPPGFTPPPDPEEAKKRYVAIPDKYQDPKTTDLKYTVKPGGQTYDPPLK